ncbi:uncharacterized protein [Anabrus simplex]
MVADGVILQPPQLSSIHSRQFLQNPVLPSYQLVIPYAAAPVPEAVAPRVSSAAYGSRSTAYQRQLFSNGRGQFFVVFPQAPLTADGYTIRQDGYFNPQAITYDQSRNLPVPDNSFFSTTAEVPLRQQTIQHDSPRNYQDGNEYEDQVVSPGARFIQPESQRYSSQRVSETEVALPTARTFTEKHRSPASRTHSQNPSYTVNVEGKDYGYGYSVRGDNEASRQYGAFPSAGQRERYFDNTVTHSGQTGTE